MRVAMDSGRGHDRRHGKFDCGRVRAAQILHARAGGVAGRAKRAAGRTAGTRTARLLRRLRVFVGIRVVAEHPVRGVKMMVFGMMVHVFSFQ